MSFLIVTFDHAPCEPFVFPFQCVKALSEPFRDHLAHVEYVVAELLQRRLIIRPRHTCGSASTVLNVIPPSTLTPRSARGRDHHTGTVVSRLAGDVALDAPALGVPESLLGVVELDELAPGEKRRSCSRYTPPVACPG
jgi:hypothetical protein